MNTDGINSTNDITLSGDSDAYFDRLTCETFQDVSGSYFTGITSNIQTQINGISGGLSGTYVTLATAQNITGAKSFNTVLPTSTITPTTSTQLITKGFADGAYAAAGSGVSLSANNTWTGTNQFNKGILPCTTWSTTNIQVGGLNTMQNRQTVSLDNVCVGVDTMKGDSNPAGYTYSTGSRNTAVGNYVLMQQGSGNDNVAIGYQAMQLTGLERVYGTGVSPNNCIAIGVGSQKTNLYGSNNISIGKNCLNNVGSGSDNIIIANYAGNGLGNVGSNVVIGNGAMPTAVDNGIVCIGAGALAFASGQCNSGVFVGAFAGTNNVNGNSNTFIGGNAGSGNITGSQNNCLGSYAGRLSISNGNYMTCIGYDSRAFQSNEFVIGSETYAERAELTLPNKTRLACNQTQTGVTVTLTFRTNENVLLTDASTNTINLPTPNADGRSVGCKFYINRQVAGGNITINAPAGQTIALNQIGGTYTASSTYLFLAGMNSITLLCIASTGTSWQVLPVSYSQGTDNLYTSAVNTNPTTAISIPFAGTTVSGYQQYFMDNANLNYKQSTTTLTATNVTSSGTVTAGAVNISNKTNLATNQNVTGSPTLSFSTAENVFLTDASSSAIILPIVTAANIGAKFIITRKVTGVDITINAPALTSVGYTSVDGAFVTSGIYTFSKFMPSITAISVATTGTTYMLIEGAVPKISRDFQPFKTKELLASATVLPDLPTLYGVYYFASGVSATTITLPTITADIIGCQLNFRRITNTTSALIIKTPSGSAQTIVQRASVTETAAFTDYTFLATTNFVGTLVALTTTKWSTID